MKKYICLIILLLIVTGCIGNVDDSNRTDLVDVEVTDLKEDNEEDTFIDVEQDYIEEFIDEAFVIVNANILNIHNSFDIESTIISEAYQSQIFTVYEVKEDEAGRKWFKISADDHEWIAGWHCSIIDIASIVGIYEYENPYNTTNHNENHTLTFEIIDHFLVGRYYGTTDDFDEGREGYYVGYYVCELLDLRIEANEIRFDLNPTTSDMFTEKITIEIKNSKEALNAGFINWQPGLNITESVTYSGHLGDNIITIDTVYGEREFKKIVDSE